MREKYTQLERPFDMGVPEALRTAEERRQVFAQLQAAASGAPQPPAIAPTAMAARNARALLSERYPDAVQRQAARDMVSSPLASARIAAQGSKGHMRRAFEPVSPTRAAADKGPLLETLELRAELEKLLQAERAMQAENAEISEAVTSTAQRADFHRAETVSIRDLRATSPEKGARELPTVRTHLLKRRQEVQALRKAVARKEQMGRATDLLRKVLREVVPERILRTVMNRWCDVVYFKKMKALEADAQARAPADAADVLESSAESRSPSPQRGAPIFTPSKEPTAKKRTIDQSPGAQKRAERRAKARGGGAAGYHPVEGGGAAEADEVGIFGNFTAGLGLFAGADSEAALVGGAADSDTVDFDATDANAASWGDFGGFGGFGGLFDGADDDEDDGDGEWFQVYGEDDDEDELEKRKADYVAVDKQRAKDQLAPLFAKRGSSALRPGGAKDRKEARKAAQARKQAGKAAAAETAGGLPTVTEETEY